MALTKQGALLITHDIDRVASVISAEFKALGLPERVATGFAEWCDRVSDRIETTAGLDPQDKAARLELMKQALSGQQDHKNVDGFNDSATWDAEEIGEEVSGRSEGDADETFMNGEFTQQENRELRDMQESGNLAGVNTDPRGARPGVQASMRSLMNTLKNGSFSDAAAKTKLAEALRLAAEIAKSAADDEDEDDKGDEEVASKKASGHGYNLNA
jgi:hypothetical protein